MLVLNVPKVLRDKPGEEGALDKPEVHQQPYEDRYPVPRLSA